MLPELWTVTQAVINAAEGRIVYLLGLDVKCPAAPTSRKMVPGLARKVATAPAPVAAAFRPRCRGWARSGKTPPSCAKGGTTSYEAKQSCTPGWVPSRKAWGRPETCVRPRGFRRWPLFSSAGVPSPVTLAPTDKMLPELWRVMQAVINAAEGRIVHLLGLDVKCQGGPYQGNMPEGEEARGKVNEASTAHATVSGFNAVQAEIDPEHLGFTVSHRRLKQDGSAATPDRTVGLALERRNLEADSTSILAMQSILARVFFRRMSSVKLAVLRCFPAESSGSGSGWPRLRRSLLSTTLCSLPLEKLQATKKLKVFCDDGGETCDDALHFTYGQKHGIFAICEVFRDDGGEPRDDALHYKVGIKRDIFVIYEVHIRKTTPRGALAPTTQRLRSILAGCRSSPKAASGRKAEAAAAS
ncbi:unnamed protein product [Effrenium voratum]|nr:unnamed protein product [Effrenium voratum]